MKTKLLFSGLLFLATTGHSQIALTNTGVLYIKTSSDVFYNAGDFANTSSGSLTINGSLYLKGNINNDASINIGTGTVFINGAVAQTISGTQPFNVYNLTTNNPAGIQLNTDLSIAGAHSFVSGIITTSSTPNFVIYESGSSYADASDARHVNGWVKKIGSTDFIFPTGNGTYLREIGLQNLSAASEFNVQYSGPSFNPSSVQYPIVSVNPGEHWTINEVAGGNAKVQLDWDSSKVPFPNYVVSDLRAAVYSGAQWTNAGGTASGSVATNGTVVSNSLSSFGRVTIGSISFPLPLKFVAFSAVKENTSVKLKWQTANEEGVRGYEVQRSLEGSSFVTVATINATNRDQQWYQFVDATSPSLRLYYRIKANNLDGKSTFTKVIMVTSENIRKIQLVNNPVSGFIQLVTQNVPKSVYTYRIFNSIGQVCKQGSFICEGSSLITISIDHISPGQYNLLIVNGDQEKRFGLLIE
jgi:hypothetical protein